MPTELPKHRSYGLNRWHLTGMAIGYAAVLGVMFWVAVERASLAEPVTNEIAPVSQRGKPLLIQ